MNYKKSPIYRTGNKHKLLHKLVPLFPQDINNFYDVFGGSGVVAINATAKNKRYNELDQKTFEMIKYIKSNGIKAVEEYNKFKEAFYNGNDKEFFELTKKSYNKNKIIAELWYLSFMSFSNDLRYNEKGHMNSPFGKRMSEEKLYHVNNFDNIEISNLDFKDFINVDNLTEKDFVFIDPPYLQSAETNKSTYNDRWNYENEKELLDLCKKFIDKEIKFMITNTIRNKGIENNLLINFIEENNLNTKVLNTNNNSNGKQNADYLEVAIFNYEPFVEQLEFDL